MPEYYAVGGSFNTSFPRHSLFSRYPGQIAYTQGEIDNEFLPYVLFKSFGARCRNSMPLDQGIRLFNTEQEAIDFVKQQEERENKDSWHSGTTTYYPYFLIDTQEEWPNQKVPSSKIKQFYQDTRVINSNIIGFADYKTGKYPQELVDEANRPLFDSMWWLVFLCTFYTIIVPILYTLYRLSKKENALNVLENNGTEKKFMSMSRAYGYEISRINNDLDYLLMDKESYDAKLKEPKYHDINYPSLFVPDEPDCHIEEDDLDQTSSLSIISI